MEIRKGKRVFVTVGMIVGLTLAGVLASGCTSSQIYSRNLVNGTITVEAGSSYSQSFSVTSGMANVRVVGKFQTAGGSADRIEVYVLDQNEYVSWSDNQTFNSIYDSGPSASGDVNTTVSGQGTFYIVLSNALDKSAAKQVTTRLDITWQDLQYP